MLKLLFKSNQKIPLPPKTLNQLYDWCIFFWILSITIVPKNWKIHFHGNSGIYELFLYLPCLMSYQISKKYKSDHSSLFPLSVRFGVPAPAAAPAPAPIAISQHFIFKSISVNLQSCLAPAQSQSYQPIWWENTLVRWFQLHLLFPLQSIPCRNQKWIIF